MAALLLVLSFIGRLKSAIPGAWTIVEAIGLVAHPTFAQANSNTETFWKRVQATCDTPPPLSLQARSARRAAQTAIDEFARFDGHLYADTQPLRY